MKSHRAYVMFQKNINLPTYVTHKNFDKLVYQSYNNNIGILGRMQDE